MNRLRQQGGCVRHFHAIPYRARLAPPNSRWGLLNCRIKTQQNHYLCHHLPSRSPCVSRGVRQALPRHSASHQVGTPQLTFGALEFQNTNTTKSLSLPPFVFMPPLRQQGGCVRHFHAIPHRAGLAPPPNSRWGLLNSRIRTQKNHCPKQHLSSRAPCVSRGVRQALPRHSASHQVGTPQLTLGALELQKTNTEKSLFLSPFVFINPLRQQGGASGTSTLLRIAPGWRPPTHVAGS